MMKDVYSSAEAVFSWLAPEDGNIPVAFDTLRAFLPHEEYDIRSSLQNPIPFSMDDKEKPDSGS